MPDGKKKGMAGPWQSGIVGAKKCIHTSEYFEKSLL